MTAETRAELAELIDAAIERTMDEAQRDRLERLLSEDESARVHFVRLLHLQASLSWDLGGAAESKTLVHLKRRAAVVGSFSRRLRRAALVLCAAAAVVLLVALLRSYNSPFTDPRSAPAMAVLTGVVDASWEGDKSYIDGAWLGRETLHLRKGWARLEFASGASVSLEGPAELEICGGDRAYLRRGQLTAVVPPRAIGFRIDTADLDVVDLGTSFGMVVEASGAAEVCVFDGEVELSAHQATHRIPEGASARLEAGAKVVQDVPYNAKRFERAWPIAFGVLKSTGAVKFMPPAPGLRPRRYRDPHYLIVFPERESVVLPAAITATVRETGWHHGPFEDRAAMIPAGTKVRSYLLQFYPGLAFKTDVQRLKGSLTFDRPILAVLATTSHLSASDAVLGADGSRHSEKARGIEIGDAFALSADRRTLTLDWTAAGGVDQLRVVVAGAP